jgi:hypothetical protein
MSELTKSYTFKLDHRIVLVLTLGLPFTAQTNNKNNMSGPRYSTIGSGTASQATTRAPPQARGGRVRTNNQTIASPTHCQPDTHILHDMIYTYIIFLYYIILYYIILYYIMFCIMYNTFFWYQSWAGGLSFRFSTIL